MEGTWGSKMPGVVFLLGTENCWRLKSLMQGLYHQLKKYLEVFKFIYMNSGKVLPKEEMYRVSDFRTRFQTWEALEKSSFAAIRL